MKILLKDITEAGIEEHYDQTATWLASAASELEEKDDSLPRPPGKRPQKPARFDVNLRKINDFYSLEGQIQAQIQLLCSRCASSFEFPCNERISELFTEDRASAETPITNHHLDPEEPMDSEVTLLTERSIDLRAVVSERLRLLLPVQPLCQEECKGMCQQCGADLNRGRCACEKLRKASPFSVLKGFKTGNS